MGEQIIWQTGKTIISSPCTVKRKQALLRSNLSGIAVSTYEAKCFWEVWQLPSN